MSTADRLGFTVRVGMTALIRSLVQWNKEPVRETAGKDTYYRELSQEHDEMIARDSGALYGY